MDFKTGYWIANNAAVNIHLGWIPDFVIVICDKVTDPRILWYQNSAALSAAAATGLTGWLTAHADDVDNLAPQADITHGIAAFDSNSEYVMIESPVAGRGEKPTVVQTWATGITPVARSATVIGTILRPTVKNGYIYECTNLTGIIAGAEPTWPVVPGATVIDADTNTWTCREEKFARDGGKGFTVLVDDQTDSEYCVFMAWRTDRDNYLGDADEGDLCIVQSAP